MFGTLAENPILERLVRHSRWPSLRSTAWIGGGLALLNLAYGLYLFLVSRGRWTVFDSALLVTAWALTLLCPMAALATAVVLTAREARSQKGQLLRLTHLPEITLAHGYMFTTLFRLRLFLAAVAGLAPFLIVGMLQLHIRYRFATVCYPGSSCGPSAIMTPPHIAGPLVVFGGLVVGLMGLNLFGAGLGVWLALWAPRAAELVTAALVLGCLIAAALTAALLYKDAMTLPYDDVLTVSAFVLPIWIPYALAPVVMRLASRQMRSLPITAQSN